MLDLPYPRCRWSILVRQTDTVSTRVVANTTQHGHWGDSTAGGVCYGFLKSPVQHEQCKLINTGGTGHGSVQEDHKTYHGEPRWCRPDQNVNKRKFRTRIINALYLFLTMIYTTFRMHISISIYHHIFNITFNPIQVINIIGVSCWGGVRDPNIS